MSHGLVKKFCRLLLSNNSTEKGLIIGRNCFIGRRNFITVGKKIVIGDFFFSSVDCLLVCATHLFSDYTPYILGEIDNDKSIIIGCNVFMGARSKIIGNVRIGYGSIIGANATVLKDIPPLSVVIGNGKIIKRYNMETKKWDNPEKVRTELYVSEEEYLEKLLKKYPIIPKFKYAASAKEGWL